MIVIMFKMLKNCLKFGIIFELHVVSQSSLVMVDDPTCTEPTRPMINKGDNPGQTTLMIPLALITLVRSSSRCSCGEVEGPAGGLALSWDLSQKSITKYRSIPISKIRRGAIKQFCHQAVTATRS